MPARQDSRRALLSLVVATMAWLAVGLTLSAPAAANESDDATLLKRFEYLSASGNSSCSGAFMGAIATMPATARLQGSCCAPMDAHRYIEQVGALRAYAEIGEIPPDPYDIEAGQARKLAGQYMLDLAPSEQAAYDYAMANSDERGPCCCGCWRWYVYGGLAKQLIRDRGFSGEQIVKVWNLSNGCGGTAHMHD